VILPLHMRTINVQPSYLQLHSILREPKPCHTHGHVHTGLARRLRVRIVLHSDDDDRTHVRVQKESNSTPAHSYIHSSGVLEQKGLAVAGVRISMLV
jgi:hypothetical protein